MYSYVCTHTHICISTYVCVCIFPESYSSPILKFQRNLLELDNYKNVPFIKRKECLKDKIKMIA